jgi:hypothetical protein
MSLLWADLRFRIIWLAVLQLILLVLNSAVDGLMGLITEGILLLPTTVLLLIAGFTALKWGYWVSAAFAALVAFPGFFGVLLWIMMVLS